MDWEAGKAYINPSPWLRYWRIFSTLFYGGGNRRTRRKPPCTARVLKTLPTYSQAENRTRVAEVEGESVAARPTVHPKNEMRDTELRN